MADASKGGSVVRLGEVNLRQRRSPGVTNAESCSLLVKAWDNCLQQSQGFSRCCTANQDFHLYRSTWNGKREDLNYWNRGRTVTAEDHTRQGVTKCDHASAIFKRNSKWWILVRPSPLWFSVVDLTATIALEWRYSRANFATKIQAMLKFSKGPSQVQVGHADY